MRRACCRRSTCGSVPSALTRHIDGTPAYKANRTGGGARQETKDGKAAGHPVDDGQGGQAGAAGDPRRSAARARPRLRLLRRDVRPRRRPALRPRESVMTQAAVEGFEPVARGLYLEGLAVDLERGVVWCSDVVA